ncbi:MAG TPA: hypothetical protein VFW35_07810 [Sphingomicrobium sp.]|nr:hypothetical protein [Sphingomicrobium sp.]
MVLLTLSSAGCTRKEQDELRPQSAAECRQQFENADLSKFFDQVTTRKAKGHWPAASVSFEVIAAKRSATELENFIAKLAGDQTVSIEPRGDLILIAVDRSRILDQGAASLSGDLAAVCSVVAANDAQLTRWRYTLHDMSLDDGLMHTPPVP